MNKINKKTFIFFLLLVFIVITCTYNIYANPLKFKRDSSKKINYSLEIEALLIFKTKGEYIVKSKYHIGKGMAGLVSYNFSKKWSITSGYGFNTKRYYVESQKIDLSSNTKSYYDKTDVKYIVYNIPLYLKYILISEKKYQYYIIGGVSIDYQYPTQYNIIATYVDSIVINEQYKYSKKYPWDISYCPNSEYRNTSYMIGMGSRHPINQYFSIYANLSYTFHDYYTVYFGEASYGRFLSINLGIEI